MKKRNSLKERRCGTCKYWHNPNGERIAWCVRHPPQVVIGGMVPQGTGPIVDPTKPQQVQMKPLIFSFCPNVGDEDGCWEWEQDPQDLN